MIKTLAQEFGVNNDTQELAGFRNIHAQSIGNYRIGGVITPFATTDSRNRVPKIALEQLYFRNTIVRNSVRRQVQMIDSAGYRIEYNNPREEKLFTKLFDNLGMIGDSCDFDQIYSSISKNEFIFGGGWIELVWDEKDEKIVDIDKFDPRKMDYARTSNHQIIVGEDQKPIGYTMALYTGANKVPGLGDKVPKQYKDLVHLGDEKIFVLPKRVALIRLEEEGDGLEFWGLVETIYRDSVRKEKLEEAGFNSAFQRWMAPLIAYIGDQTHPPTPALTSQTLQQMKKMKHDLLSTYPYYVKLDTLKGNEMESYIEMLKSIRENEASGLQMPMPFAMSSGEATNRATLNNQQSMLEFSLNALAKLNAKEITKRIFKPIAESMGLKSWPRLISNRISVDEIEDKGKRFSSYVKHGLFSPEELRPILAKEEGITLIAVPEPPKKKGEDEDKEDDKTREEIDKEMDSIEDKE